MDNAGNAYRTRGAVVAIIAIIALAICVILYGATDMELISIVGVFVLLIGVDLAILSISYSSTPDKFGPSEQDYRLIVGLFLIVVGLVGIVAGFDVDWYVYVVVLLIGIALVGLVATIRGNKSSKY